MWDKTALSYAIPRKWAVSEHRSVLLTLFLIFKNKPVYTNYHACLILYAPHALVRPLPFRTSKGWLYSCCCFIRRDSESPVPGSHDDYVNREVLRDYANRDSLCDDYGDDYANREAIREAQREREREKQANEYREYVNAPSTWQQDSGDDNRNTQRRQSHRG